MMKSLKDWYAMIKVARMNLIRMISLILKRRRVLNLRLKISKIILLRKSPPNLGSPLGPLLVRRVVPKILGFERFPFFSVLRGARLFNEVV